MLLRSGHTERTFKPFGEGKGCPALGADAVEYMHAKGIRCVGTDGPTLGGVDEKQALLTYWALGSHAMIGVELLTNLGALPDKAFSFSLWSRSTAATVRRAARSRCIEGPVRNCRRAN